MSENHWTTSERRTLTLFVVDRSPGLLRGGRQNLDGARGNALICWWLNKVDLEGVVRIPSELESGARSRSDVSALTGQGLDLLRRAIREAVTPDSDWERERVVDHRTFGTRGVCSVPGRGSAREWMPTGTV